MPKDEESYTFELVMFKRDSRGNPTSQRISKKSDKAGAIAAFWYKEGAIYGKKRKRKTDKAATKDQADKILTEMNKSTPNVDNS